MSYASRIGLTSNLTIYDSFYIYFTANLQLIYNFFQLRFGCSTAILQLIYSFLQLFTHYLQTRRGPSFELRFYVYVKSHAKESNHLNPQLVWFLSFSRSSSGGISVSRILSRKKNPLFAFSSRRRDEISTLMPIPVISKILQRTIG